MNQTPVFVIDDDADMRDALVLLLRGEGLRARSFGSAREFLDALPDAPIACVITDIRMPDMSGDALVRELKSQRGPAWPVIVITGHGEVPLAVELMKEGVFDFIEKPFDPPKIVAVVKACIIELKQRQSEWDQRDAIKSRLETLTPREHQVFEALIVGKSNKEIAIDLDISPRTIEIFRAKLMHKMAADSLSALVRMGLTVGVS